MFLKAKISFSFTILLYLINILCVDIILMKGITNSNYHLNWDTNMYDWWDAMNFY